MRDNIKMTAYTLPFNEIGQDQFALVGGKCASLGEMTQAGVNVPPGFAVTTTAFAEMLAAHDLRAEIDEQLKATDTDNVSALENVALSIGRCITEKPMPADVEASIRTAYQQMGNDLPVAVRSSATAEDLPDASFAGQQDTYLWVSGADSVVEKVRDCWASLFTARAIAYREKNNIAHHDVLMSVGVQKMVNAKCAGVAMTLDPANGDRTRIVIDSSWGLGETVVSGTVTPDNYVVEKVLQEILHRTISDKHMEMVGDTTAGTAIERDITDDRRQESSLSDDEVLAVAMLAKQLEKQNKCPQDVEWAIDADLPDGENLMALQSRPETIWSQKKKDKPKNPYATGVMSIASTLSTPYGTKK